MWELRLRLLPSAPCEELDFEAALRGGSPFKGLPGIFLLESAERGSTSLREPRDLVDELHKRGYKVGLVSGGFHETVDRLAEQLGIITSRQIVWKSGRGFDRPGLRRLSLRIPSLPC